MIWVGGVEIGQAGALRASDYASGFDSNLIRGDGYRTSPGWSGCARAAADHAAGPGGLRARPQLAGGTHPEGDETAGDDGWAVFSGTSAACPQVAGVCALILQACAGLSPSEVRDLLTSTARDVTAGTNHPNFGNAAVPGPDDATGDGLVDAQRAVLLAKLRCPEPAGGRGALGRRTSP